MFGFSLGEEIRSYYLESLLFRFFRVVLVYIYLYKVAEENKGSVAVCLAAKVLISYSWILEWSLINRLKVKMCTLLISLIK